MPSVCKPQPNEPYNLIYFGAPGTGKSYKMNKLSTQLFDESRILRVTFHPDYTYAQFVGSLRPYTDVITGKSGYRYTPGPFVDAYVQAMQLEDPVVLLIEEIQLPCSAMCSSCLIARIPAKARIPFALRKS